MKERASAVDVARGVAVVLMISTHAFDGWVAEAERGEFAYRVTRWLGLLPLPSFLFLAGLGTAMALESARRRGRATRDARRDTILRGLRVVVAGYAVSATLAVIDGGFAARTVLRADVLHAIGFSIVAYGAVLASLPAARGAAERERRNTEPYGAALASATFLACALLTPYATTLGRTAEPALAPWLAPWVEVAGWTRMPVVPLVAWLALGAAVGPPLVRARPATQVGVAAAGATVAWGAALATTAWHAAVGGTLDRSHPAIAANLVDLGARATACVAICLALASHLPDVMRRALEVVGRHSLLAYAVHLPFAYGRIPSSFARSLSMTIAASGFVALVAFSYGAARLADEREARRSRR